MGDVESKKLSECFGVVVPEGRAHANVVQNCTIADNAKVATGTERVANGVCATVERR